LDLLADLRLDELPEAVIVEPAGQVGTVVVHNRDAARRGELVHGPL
jgi:hypothetical protein